jgi:hypothetical protein
MVRAANTGVTCVVNEFGRVTQVLRDDQGSIFEEGTLIGEINIATEPSLTFLRATWRVIRQNMHRIGAGRSIGETADSGSVQRNGGSV